MTMARKSLTAPLLLALGAGMLSACGLQPLYSNGSNGEVAGMLGAIDVAPIEGRAGWLVRNHLNDRLGAMGDSGARYRLQIVLDDDLQGFGLRQDDTVTRERRTLRARYQLIDLSTGEPLLDATAGSDAGIDVVSSDYATIAAEDTALENLSRIVADQIISRIAIFARGRTSP